MELASLLGIGFVGSVFWVVNAELTAILYGSQLGWHPLAVGLLIGAAQTAMYVLLYFGGAQAMTRWAWLDRQVVRVRDRFQERLERAYLPASGVAAILGVPPVIALVALAPGFQVPLLHVVPIAFAGRVVRFSILAAFGERLVAWWG